MERKIGCLIIHGFGGNIEEISPLSEFLKNRGYITACPMLAGHTGRRRDLAWISYTEWIKSADEALQALREQCEDLILIGFSMGGLIAVNLAQKYKITALITLSTPIYHWDLKRVGLNIIKDFQSRKFKSIKYYTRAAVAIPFSAMFNFKVFLSKTKPLFKEINCPIFIAQGMVDDTVHYRSAGYINNKVSSEIKTIKYYSNSDHIICRAEDREELFGDMEAFIDSVVKGGAQDEFVEE